MKNILFLISGLNVGGTEKLLVDLANTIDETRFNIIVVSLGRDNSMKKFITRNGVTAIEYPRKARFDFSPVRYIAGLIRERNIEGVLCFSPFVYLFIKFALRNTSQPKLPVYVAFHNTEARNLKEYLQTFLYVRLFENNVRLISICETQARHCRKVYFISQESFRTIYNGVDIHYFNLVPHIFNKQTILSQFSIPQNARVIVQVAGLRKEKKHEDSLRALRFLHDHYRQKAYLLFVGDGSDEIKNRLREMIDTLSLNEYIRFCGRQDDVRPFYWSSDLFTLSSVAVETFSISALEAMSCGLPCVLTNVGGVREMIVEGTNGYIVPPNDPEALACAWEKILRAREVFSAKDIRQIVEDKFSLQKCVRKYEEIFAPT